MGGSVVKKLLIITTILFGLCLIGCEYTVNTVDWNKCKEICKSELRGVKPLDGGINVCYCEDGTVVKVY